MVLHRLHPPQCTVRALSHWMYTDVPESCSRPYPLTIDSCLMLCDEMNVQFFLRETPK